MSRKMESVWCVFWVSFWVFGGFSACSSGKDEATTSVLSNTELSEFSREILSDGKVTRSELEEAKEKTIACLEAEGFTASFRAEDDRVDTLSIDSNGSLEGETEAEFEKRFDETTETCTDEYWSAVDDVWLKQTEPSEEEIQAAFTTLKECIAPYDVEVASSDPEDLLPIVEKIENPDTEDEETRVLSECFKQYSLAAATSE